MPGNGLGIVRPPRGDLGIDDSTAAGAACQPKDRQPSLSTPASLRYPDGMTLRHYPNRFLIASALSSLLLLGLCGSVAVYLNWEQSRTADALGEDLGSRRAAADL